MSKLLDIFLNHNYIILIYISIIIAFIIILSRPFKPLKSKISKGLGMSETQSVSEHPEKSKISGNSETKGFRVTQKSSISDDSRNFQSKLDIKNRTLKIIYFILFLPIAVIPLIKCYFKIPYILCKACPRKCVFGELRSFIIPSFILLNLDKRFWCYKLCPFGTIQDYQAKLCKKRIKPPKAIIYLRYFFLIFTIIAVLLLIFNENLKNPFFVGTYKVIILTIIAAAIIFILSFFIPRFWCNYFCPVGSFADLTLKLENRIKR